MKPMHPPLKLHLQLRARLVAKTIAVSALGFALFGFESPPQALTLVQGLEQAVLAVEKAPTAQERLVRGLLEQAEAARKEIALYASGLKSGAASQLADAALYSTRYLNALGRISVQYARLAHAPGNDLRKYDFQEFDAFALRLPQEVVNNLSAVYSLNLRHVADLSSDDSELFLNAFDTELAEYTALHDLKSAVDYAKLVQFSATRTSLANRYSSDRIFVDVYPDAPKPQGLPFLSFRTVDGLPDKPENTRSYAIAHAKYDASLALVSQRSIERLLSQLRGLALADGESFERVFYDALSVNSDFAFSTQNLGLFEKTESVSAWAQKLYAREQAVWNETSQLNHKDILAEVLEVFNLGDEIDANAIAQRLSSRLFSLRAGRLAFGAFQVASSQYGVRDQAGISKALLIYFESRKERFLTQARARIAAWVKDQKSFKTALVQKGANFSNRVEELTETVTPALPAAQTLEDIEAQIRSLVKAAMAKTGMDVPEARIRDAHLRTPVGFDRYPVRIDTPSGLQQLYFLRKGITSEAAGTTLDIAGEPGASLTVKPILSPFFEALQSRYDSETRKLKRKPSESEFVALAQDAARTSIVQSRGQQLESNRVAAKTTQAEAIADREADPLGKKKILNANLKKGDIAQSMPKTRLIAPTALDPVNAELALIHLSWNELKGRAPILRTLGDVEFLSQALISSTVAKSAILENAFPDGRTIFQRAANLYDPRIDTVNTEKLRGLVRELLIETRKQDRGIAEIYLAADARRASDDDHFKVLFRSAKSIRKALTLTMPAWESYDGTFAKKTETRAEKADRYLMLALVVAGALLLVCMGASWALGLIGVSKGFIAAVAIPYAIASSFYASLGLSTAMMVSRGYVAYHDMPLNFSFSAAVAQSRFNDREKTTKSFMRELFSEGSATERRAMGLIDTPIMNHEAVKSEKLSMQLNQALYVPLTLMDILFNRMAIRHLVGSQYIEAAYRFQGKPRPNEVIFNKTFWEQAPSLVKPKQVEALVYPGLSPLTQSALAESVGRKAGQLMTESRIPSVIQRVRESVAKLQGRLNANGELKGLLTLKESINPANAPYTYFGVVLRETAHYVRRFFGATGLKSVKDLIKEGVEIYGAYAPRSMIEAERRGMGRLWLQKFGKRLDGLLTYRSMVLLKDRIPTANAVLARIELLEANPTSQKFAQALLNSSKRLGLSAESLAFIKANKDAAPGTLLVRSMNAHELQAFGEMLNPSILQGRYWQQSWQQLFDPDSSLRELGLMIKDANLLMMRLAPSSAAKVSTFYDADAYTQFIEGTSNEQRLTQNSLDDYLAVAIQENPIDEKTVLKDLEHFKNAIDAFDDVRSMNLEISAFRKKLEQELADPRVLTN